MGYHSNFIASPSPWDSRPCMHATAHYLQCYGIYRKVSDMAGSKGPAGPVGTQIHPDTFVDHMLTLCVYLDLQYFILYRLGPPLLLL
jgi:hypothetical protein